MSSTVQSPELMRRVESAIAKLSVDDATRANLLDQSCRFSVQQVEELEKSVERSRIALLQSNSRSEFRSLRAQLRKVMSQLAAKQFDSVKSAIAKALQPDVGLGLAEAIAEQFAKDVLKRVPEYSAKIASQKYSGVLEKLDVERFPQSIEEMLWPRRFANLDDGIASPSDVHLAFGALELATRKVAPDVIVALNKGGRIVGEYLNRRLGDPDLSVLAVEISKHDDLSRLTDNLKLGLSPQTKKVMIVDDISRSGETITRAIQRLKVAQPNVEISTATLVCSQASLANLTNAELICPLLVPIADVRLPYDSHGAFSFENDVNVFGSPGNNISFTDHEAELYFKEAKRETILFDLSDQ